MSENITHIAVCDDSLRLLVQMPETCQAFRSAISEHLDIAELGAVTRSTDRFNPNLLQRIRDGWETRRPEQNLERKLAYSLGALCHRAADRTMKPIFAQVAPEDTQNPKTISIYHDVFLFREVYKEGVEKPYSPAMFASETAFEEHFRVLVQRALLSIHTFIPDLTDPEGWLDRLFKLRQDFYVALSRYAETYYHPDPELTQRYLTEVNFYNPKDDLIRLARMVQTGHAVTSDAVERALHSGQSESRYAYALRRGLGYLRAANRFFIGALDLDGLKTACEIGRPELAG